MGTLGCISDMLRRDKENRDLRKRNHEKFYETRERMLHVKRGSTNPNLSIESLEKRRKETDEKNIKDRHVSFRFYIKFLLICISFVIIITFILYYLM